RTSGDIFGSVVADSEAEITLLDVNEPSLVHLLYALHLLNTDEDESKRIIYQYSEEALEMINEKWNGYTLIVREAIEYDSFLTSIYAITKVQINRLVGALDNVRIADMILEIVRDQQQGLSYHDFKIDTMERIKSAVEEFKRNKRFETISSVTAQSSLALMDYYICQKKIYANRKIEETLKELRAQCEEQNDEAQQENQFSNQIPEVERNPHKTILLSPGQKLLREYLMKHHGGLKVNSFKAQQENLKRKD
ncbi:unnamed protein product, partial [Didymodactylos carnosus]